MKRKIKKQVWLPIDRIVRTNPNLNREVVDQIKKNCSPLRFGAIPGAFTKDYQFKITDGNHRVQAIYIVSIHEEGENCRIEMIGFENSIVVVYDENLLNFISKNIV